MDGTALWDSPVGLEYGSRFQDIEAARRLFIEGRWSAMDRAYRLLRSLAGPICHETELSSKAKENPWQEFVLDLDSEYRRVRSAPSKDWSAGVHVLLAPMPWPSGPLAFQTGGFFTMEESEFGRLQFPDKPAWPEAVRPFYKGAADEWYSAMLRFEAVPLTPADFTCDRVLAVVRELPVHFRKADAWFAEQVRSWS